LSRDREQFEIAEFSTEVRRYVRIVAATHQDLEARIGEGRFRQDLYGRLLGYVAHLPPLRLVIVGAVHVAQPLAEMAGLAGFAVTIVDPRNATAGPSCIDNPCQPGRNNPTGGPLLDGGLYPNTFKFATQTKEYGSFLPSINAVYEVTDDFQIRGSMSRTMTRANPNQMISGVNFGDVTAQAITLGNPNLKPFYSNNIDVGFELYTGGAGYFGFTAFRKGLSGFPIQQNTTHDNDSEVRIVVRVQPMKRGRSGQSPRVPLPDFRPCKTQN